MFIDNKKGTKTNLHIVFVQSVLSIRYGHLKAVQTLNIVMTLDSGLNGEDFDRV